LREKRRLSAVMEKISKLKNKHYSVKSAADILNKRKNEMRDKPFVERLVPGVALQFQRSSKDYIME
jgi:hypothetical protein